MIEDLLIEFDEMGFAPTTVCPNAEQYAIDWRERVLKEFACLTAENAELKARLENAVELPFIIHVSNNYAVIVYVDENGKIHKTHTYATKEAEARLAELKGGRECTLYS